MRGGVDSGETNMAATEADAGAAEQVEVVEEPVSKKNKYRKPKRESPCPAPRSRHHAELPAAPGHLHFPPCTHHSSTVAGGDHGGLSSL